jgi:cytochrome c7-like protein
LRRPLAVAQQHSTNHASVFAIEAIALRLAVGTLLALFLVRPAAAPAQGGVPPAGYKAPVITDTTGLKGLRQPIFFRHDIHAGQDRIPCLYCHYSAAVSSEPGIPAVQTCIGCHQIIGGSTDSHRAEISKVRAAWRDKSPPQWVRVYAVPDFVHFPHMRHIKVLGTGPESCATCHGNVAQTTRITQVSTLKMGWCIRCHVERKVTRDCTACHY